MKPKTALQKQVAKASATLRPLSYSQKEWAYNHCFEHIAYRTKSGTITCSDCGHVWKSGKGTLCDTIAGCKCPNCGKELQVKDTLKRKYGQTSYFSVITTHNGFQVIRVAQIKSESLKGKPAKYYCNEVVQRWISANGKVTDMALLRGFNFCYCDVWSLFSDMEIRPHNSLYDDVCVWSKVYPKMSVLPQLRRNGFKGDFYGVTPVRLFKGLLSDPKIETLVKEGKIEEMRYFLSNPDTADELWASYIIARRHHYCINNLGMWCDYLKMLKNLGQDLRNPKNICPDDFIKAHDEVSRRIDAKREKERAELERRYERERREREQQRLLREKQKEQDFINQKSKFFGLVISDNEITVKVLESIEEYYEEGKTQNICVFGSSYYTKANFLILSARIDGRIIETVEVDLHTFQVVQCHGKNNKDTDYHERIVNLVNANAKKIRERMMTA